MTNEEKAKELAKTLVAEEQNNQPLVELLMQMAEWKDKQIAEQKEEIITTFNDLQKSKIDIQDANQRIAKEKQKLIDKSYEFWKHKFPYLDIYTMKEFVDTMKGE